MPTEQIPTMALTDDPELTDVQPEVETPVADVTEAPVETTEETTTETPPEPEPPKPLTDPERQRLQEFEQAQCQSAMQQAINQVDQEAVQVKAEWSAQYGEEVGNKAAAQHKSLRLRELEAALKSNDSNENERLKREYADNIGKKHGIAPDKLMNQTSVAGMEERASHLAEVARLQRAVKGTQTKATPQTFEGNASEMGGGADAKGLLTALAEDRIQPQDITPDQQKLIDKYVGA